MIPSERALIRKLQKLFPASKRVIQGIGDDCAVLPYTENTYLLISTDTLVDGNHFTTEWLTPVQIGKKAVESNVSDIAAMGGTPTAITIGGTFPKETTPEFINGFLEGVRQVCARYDIDFIGGDTTKGPTITFTVTILGEVPKDVITYRKEARVGDIIMLSGPLGGSSAGLDLLRNNKQGHTDDYKEPTARLDFSQKYAQYCSAMIDISDGLASEITHICEESHVGATIEKSKIPIKDYVKETAKIFNKDPVDYALHGGEDFELLVTVPAENVDKVDGVIIGRIMPREAGIKLKDEHGIIELEDGFDQFIQ